MIAYYDNEPSVFEKVGDGSNKYRFNITEVPAPTQEGEETRTQWRCEEVVIWEEMIKKKVVSTVINEHFGQDHELRLANEYNSAVLGVITGADATAATEAYKEFLSERKALKASVEQDCDDHGVK